ncbi:hypothetical protein AJ79_06963 [Helicocarpus griseus UAMH5409]|uniref:Uncharacterized protein n=1 Tax=Helicocarpus griseus UAMH5409 TaxID=1447875 RepID=A0A2B7X894_9EURO|nr:hypothetical protein AJ79_06963 [Helicocarpus griseus UAMH5409]
MEEDSFGSFTLGPPTTRTDGKTLLYLQSLAITTPKRSKSQPQTTAERRMGFLLGQDGNMFTEVMLDPEFTTVPDDNNSTPAISGRPSPPSPFKHEDKHREEQQYLKLEPSPRRARISRLHFGPFFLGAPAAVPSAPPEWRKCKCGGGASRVQSIYLDKAASPPQAHPERAHKELPTTSPANRLSAHHIGSSSLLQRLSSRRSHHWNLSRNLTSKRYRTRCEDCELDEDELVLTDISTLDGGSVDFGRFSLADSDESTTPDATSDSITDEHTPILNTKVIEGREVVIGPPVASGSDAIDLTQNNDDFRAKAIRTIGQQWAEREQVIVTVTEASPTVDLSSLGVATKHQSVANVERLLPVSSSTFYQDQRSHFYPPDPEQPNWKPFSIRKPFMTLLIVLSVVLAVMQEWLCQKSQSLAKQSDGLIAFNDAVEVSLASFFCWKYMPTMIFVAYGVLWQITDYDTKRLEPYYQLSQPTGSKASTSLNLDYLSVNPFWVPVKSFRYRHWAVFCSSICSLFATLIAPSLQNPSIKMVENPLCQDSPCREGASYRYFVRVHPVWSRLLTASLTVVAVFGVFLLIQLRRKSGLMSDPKGIAGIASMATKSHILTDFQEMDEAQHNEIHKRLNKHRYILYKSTIWHGEYIKQERRDPYAERKVGNPHPLVLQLKTGVAFLAFLLLCLMFIPVINFTPVNVVANKLPWLPVLIATLVKQFWAMFEFAVRAIEPFYVLSKGNATPQVTLTLDYRGTPYGLLPFQALRNRHYIVALAGFGSMLGDILTVTVSSFSVNGNDLIRRSNGSDHHQSLLRISVEDQTFLSFWTSVGLSFAILLFLIFSATLIYTRRRHPFLPRQPSTIASVLGFIYQSRMLDDFVNTERLDNWQMEERLKATGKRYGLGWFKGRDGRPHCAVDEEPMLSQYVHGASYIKATAPWEDI